MPMLTDKQIQYGFDYCHGDGPKPKSVTEVSQYRGEPVLLFPGARILVMEEYLEQILHELTRRPGTIALWSAASSALIAALVVAIFSI